LSGVVAERTDVAAGSRIDYSVGAEQQPHRRKFPHLRRDELCGKRLEAVREHGEEIVRDLAALGDGTQATARSVARCPESRTPDGWSRTSMPQKPGRSRQERAAVWPGFRVAVVTRSDGPAGG
jgi:hypothetical protein